MNVLVWGIEWRLALASRRRLALRVVLPLLLVFVIATGGLPVDVACAAYVALFSGLGLLETSLPLLADQRSGLAARVMRGGVSSASYLLQRAAATTALLFLGLLPAVAVIAVTFRASLVAALLSVAALATTLWIACLAGVLVTAVSRSTVETLVLSCVGLVVLLHMSGVLHTPAADGFGALLEGASPFRFLHEAFVQMSSGGAVHGASAAAAWSVILPTLVGFTATHALRHLRATA